MHLFLNKVNILINNLTYYTQKATELLTDYSPKLVSAGIILVIGIYSIRFINRMVTKIMLKREIEPTLSKFLADSLNWAMRGILFIAVISKLGIETSSFVTILGAAGLAIGLSLQGSLSNIAGGVLIILFKPFRVGDVIEAQGVIGTVNEIQIFVTKLTTANNQTIFIPNGVLSNGTIINYSIEKNRRANLTFAISYETNIKVAKEIVMKIMKNHPKVLKNPAPTVVIDSLTDSSVVLAIRPWTKNEHFWEVYSDVLENCKTAFDEAGIAIQPFVKEESKKK